MGSAGVHRVPIRHILEGRFGPKDVIPVDYEDGRFAFERVVH